MKDQVRALGDQRFRCAGIREIGSHDLNWDRGVGGFGGCHHVLQRHAGDFVLAEAAFAQQLFGELAATMPAAPRMRMCKTRLLFELFYSAFKRSGNRFA